MLFRTASVSLAVRKSMSPCFRAPRQRNPFRGLILLAALIINVYVQRVRDTERIGC